MRRLLISSERGYRKRLKAIDLLCETVGDFERVQKGKALQNFPEMRLATINGLTG